MPYCVSRLLNGTPWVVWQQITFADWEFRLKFSRKKENVKTYAKNCFFARFQTLTFEDMFWPVWCPTRMSEFWPSTFETPFFYLSQYLPAVVSQEGHCYRSHQKVDFDLVNKMAICRRSFREERHQVTTNQHQIHNCHHQEPLVPNILEYHKMFVSKYLECLEFSKDQNRWFWCGLRHQVKDFPISNHGKLYYAENEF